MTDQPKRPRTLYKRTGRRPTVGTAVIVSELPPLHSRAVFEPDGPEALIGLLAVGYPEAPGHPIDLEEAARATGYRLKAARALMKSPAFAVTLAEARKRHAMADMPDMKPSQGAGPKAHRLKKF